MQTQGRNVNNANRFETLNQVRDELEDINKDNMKETKEKLPISTKEHVDDEMMAL